MKKHILLFAVVLLPATTYAKLPANCIDRLISKSDGLLQNLDQAINKNSSKAVNNFNGVNRAWSEYTRYYTGSWAKDCFAAAPENKTRYNQYLKDIATPMSMKTRARLDEICSAEAKKVISDSMAEINGYIEKNNQGMAESRINALENRLKKAPMIVQCPPVKDQVSSLLTKELPNLKNNAELIQHINAVRYNYSNATQYWDRSQKAFSDKSLAPLDGKSIQADYRRTIDSCLNGIKTLDKAGYGNSGLIASKGGKALSLGDVRQSCEKVNDYGLDKLFAKTDAHNEAYRKEWRANWEKKNIKGSAMQQVYSQSKYLPSDIEVLPSNIIWTYWTKSSHAIFAECKSYNFTLDGEKLLSRSVYACE